MVCQKSQRAAAVPSIHVTSVWPMLHAEIKHAVVRMGIMRMAVFAQPVSVNETL